MNRPQRTATRSTAVATKETTDSGRFAYPVAREVGCSTLFFSTNAPTCISGMCVCACVCVWWLTSFLKKLMMSSSLTSQSVLTYCNTQQKVHTWCKYPSFWAHLYCGQSLWCGHPDHSLTSCCCAVGRGPARCSTCEPSNAHITGPQLDGPYCILSVADF